MSLKGILHKEYENILKICLVFATIVYNLLIFNVNYFRGRKILIIKSKKIIINSEKLIINSATFHYVFCRAKKVNEDE